jgi:hypothetical protein
MLLSGHSYIERQKREKLTAEEGNRRIGAEREVVTPKLGPGVR